MTKQIHIFLSYAKADQGFAARIAKELEKAGAQSSGLTIVAAGDVFRHVKRELKLSDLVVFLVPSQEGEGRWALAEIGAARALDKNILAVLPDRARYANSAFVKSLTDRPMIDATDLSASALARTIMSSASAH